MADPLVEAVIEFAAEARRALPSIEQPFYAIADDEWVADPADPVIFHRTEKKIVHLSPTAIDLLEAGFCAFCVTCKKEAAQRGPGVPGGGP